MKMLSWCVFGFSLATCTVCFGQIDIYQSDAYSLEEMCAREAEQSETDYSNAYESCIANNSDNPMYQSDRNDADVQNSGNGDPDDPNHAAEAYSQNQNDQESLQSQQD